MPNLRLTLVFENSSNPELVSTRFVSPGSRDVCQCIRGKSSYGHPPGTGTFQWTSAVQALCLFFLRYAATRTDENYVLLGDGGSSAASLDLAIGKAPSWLCEMFGCYADGTPVARRLFFRSNPERRRPGPVAIRLNETIVPSASSIRIIVDAEEVTDAQTLLELANRIEQQGDATLPSKEALPLPFQNQDFFNGVLESFLQELSDTLHASDTSSNFLRTRVVKRMKADLIRGGFALNPARFLGEDTLGLTSSERLGSTLAIESLKRQLSHERPLRIAYSIGHAGTSAIFWYLKYFQKLPLELQYEFPYAIEIKRWLAADRFPEQSDLCCMGLAPAASMLTDKRFRAYRPIMVLPAMTHRILSRKPLSAGTKVDAGEWCFLDSEISTSRMFFNQLQESGLVHRRKFHILNVDPDEAFAHLLSGSSSRAILFFPHYKLQASLDPALALGESCAEAGMKELVLFGHERIMANEPLLRSITVAMRYAWLQLRVSPFLPRQVITTMLNDVDHTCALARISGFANAPLGAWNATQPVATQDPVA